MRVWCGLLPQAHTECLRYWLADAELSGTLRGRTYAGPPNYGASSKAIAPSVLSFSCPTKPCALRAEPTAWLGRSCGLRDLGGTRSRELR